MRPIVFRLLARGSLLLAVIAPSTARPATRPHSGGTLRVEMRERVTSLDPRQWPQDSVVAAATEKLAELVFERLGTLDDNSPPPPQLALSWEPDAGKKRWKFTLRSGGKNSGGAP